MAKVTIFYPDGTDISKVDSKTIPQDGQTIIVDKIILEIQSTNGVSATDVKDLIDTVWRVIDHSHTEREIYIDGP